jgi:hypothetical protein
MSDDLLQYERLVEEALRDVMRKALDIVAREGLQGDHYFHITFRTDHPGVDIPAQLRLEYPAEMPIILQNAFWDLEVGEIGFSVSLSFNRVQQRLTVPFDAITVFQDPPANFRLQFQTREEAEAAMAEEEAEDLPAVDEESSQATEETAEGGKRDEGGESGKVVPLDAFRNK